MMDREVIGQYWEAKETINIVYIQTGDTLAEYLFAIQSELIALQYSKLLVTHFIALDFRLTLLIHKTD
jgi:hypothetical protein